MLVGHNGSGKSTFLRMVAGVLDTTEGDATIAGALLEKNINIKDIEILKIRENEGGTMRLAFASEVDREMALALLKSRGLECRKRE
ncbi:MAG: glycerol-3-phosphate transporter ATP-binding subunit [bacterium ADurb.Bin431]|nr:MAG: glycerol-3-phosphate transporter ATP-binding subunit [bacterium ADurb.Bin431]